MTANQFNSTSLDERTNIVWIHGEFLAMRQQYGCKVVLYHLQEFFVEVWYHPESDLILMVRGIDNQACLEHYLEAINLGELMK